jgi:hypothetical protein
MTIPSNGEALPFLVQLGNLPFADVLASPTVPDDLDGALLIEPSTIILNISNAGAGYFTIRADNRLQPGVTYNLSIVLNSPLPSLLSLYDNSFAATPMSVSVVDQTFTVPRIVVSNKTLSTINQNSINLYFNVTSLFGGISTELFNVTLYVYLSSNDSFVPRELDYVRARTQNSTVVDSLHEFAYEEQYGLQVAIGVGDGLSLRNLSFFGLRESWTYKVQAWSRNQIHKATPMDTFYTFTTTPNSLRYIWKLSFIFDETRRETNQDVLQGILCYLVQAFGTLNYQVRSNHNLTCDTVSQSTRIKVLPYNLPLVSAKPIIAAKNNQYQMKNAFRNSSCIMTYIYPVNLNQQDRDPIAQKIQALGSVSTEGYVPGISQMLTISPALSDFYDGMVSQLPELMSGLMNIIYDGPVSKSPPSLVYYGTPQFLRRSRGVYVPTISVNGTGFLFIVRSVDPNLRTISRGDILYQRVALVGVHVDNQQLGSVSFNISDADQLPLQGGEGRASTFYMTTCTDDPTENATFGTLLRISDFFQLEYTASLESSVLAYGLWLFVVLVGFFLAADLVVL